MSTGRQKLKAAKLMVLISRGRRGFIPFRKVLPLTEAVRFVHDPQGYQITGKKEWVAEAIAIAKLICEGTEFLNTYVCPIVKKLP